MDGLEAVGSIGKYFEFLTECLDLTFYNSFVGLNILSFMPENAVQI